MEMIATCRMPLRGDGSALPLKLPCQVLERGLPGCDPAHLQPPRLQRHLRVAVGRVPGTGRMAVLYPTDGVVGPSVPVQQRSNHTLPHRPLPHRLLPVEAVPRPHPRDRIHQRRAETLLHDQVRRQEVLSVLML